MLLIAAIGCGQAASAANVNIRGKVVDHANEPIAAATVKVAGTALGVSTNADGGYRLSVAERDTLVLVYSCIGYKEVRRQLVKPNGDLTINVRLEENARELIMNGDYDDIIDTYAHTIEEITKICEE